MGGDTNLTQPQMQGYGESMQEALEAQVALLSGKKVGDSDFRSVGKLEDVVREYESPLRKATAQIDTDVMRQTLLGDETTYDEYGRKLLGYEGGEGKRKKWDAQLAQLESERKEANDAHRAASDAYKSGEDPTKVQESFAARGAAGKALGAHLSSRPKALYSELDPSKAGKIAYEGTGMVDLLGDTRSVQESVQSEDYAQYVKDNPDLQKAFGDARRAGDERTIEQFGQEHYEVYGKAEGRELAMGEYTLQDAGRQAGFDESGEFRGLSALAEDIGRGGQQRAREADIADVERLGGRATEAYRAQGDLSGALAQARGLGAGGDQGLSAIPSDPLFEGAALGTLADRARAENLGITAISGGRTGDYDPRVAAQGLQPGFQGPQQPGQQSQQFAQPGGTDAFRSALMQQGMGALDQGITSRENRAIQEAARARATNMGRTFDQTASIKEAEAVIAEDNARRMQNRAFAQSALGQEVGIQQADMARGLQAQQLELGRQSAGVDRQLTAEEKDIERIMRQQAMEEQYRQQGLGAERASAAQMVGLEQATSADPFQAILQRQGQNNLASGGALFGQAQYGLESGPQYLNPEAGLGFIQNQATNAANMFGAQQMAGATTSGGIMGGLGSLAGGLLGNPNLFKKCWVAREVYGEHNPAWLLFRNWLDTDAPRWFDKLYLTFGERFANFISNKPRLKARIRMWMDTKIGR